LAALKSDYDREFAENGLEVVLSGTTLRGREQIDSFLSDTNDHIRDLVVQDAAARLRLLGRAGKRVALGAAAVGTGFALAKLSKGAVLTPLLEGGGGLYGGLYGVVSALIPIAYARNVDYGSAKHDNAFREAVEDGSVGSWVFDSHVAILDTRYASLSSTPELADHVAESQAVVDSVSTPRNARMVWVDRFIRVEEDEQGQRVPVMDVMVRFWRPRPPSLIVNVRAAWAR
jgi:hypothetical protein